MSLKIGLKTYKNLFSKISNNYLDLSNQILEKKLQGQINNIY